MNAEVGCSLVSSVSFRNSETRNSSESVELNADCRKVSTSSLPVRTSKPLDPSKAQTDFGSSEFPGSAASCDRSRVTVEYHSLCDRRFMFMSED